MLHKLDVVEIKKANDIIFFVGRLLYALEKVSGWRPFNYPPQKGRRP